MDEKLEKALEFSKYQQTLHVQKENLKLRLDHLLLTKIEDSVVKCSMELINFLQTCVTREYEITYVMDVNNNPIEVRNIELWLFKIIDCYHMAHEEFFKKSDRLKKARNVKKVIS